MILITIQTTHHAKAKYTIGAITKYHTLSAMLEAPVSATDLDLRLESSL